MGRLTGGWDTCAVRDFWLGRWIAAEAEQLLVLRHGAVNQLTAYDLQSAQPLGYWPRRCTHRHGRRRGRHSSDCAGARGRRVRLVGDIQWQRREGVRPTRSPKFSRNTRRGYGRSFSVESRPATTRYGRTNRWALHISCPSTRLVSMGRTAGTIRRRWQRSRAATSINICMVQVRYCLCPPPARIRM